jgi:hypothetical protein
VLTIGEALLELWDLITKRITGLDSETLLAELDYVPDLSNLDKMVAEQMVRPQNDAQKAWSDTACMEELNNQLVGLLLTQPNFTLRLPDGLPSC